ncbi:MAG: SGNH/GDSL hydrolase family protein [Rhodococcus sp. (in: high G+C Gram-positive bacteria)]|uniref:SGNH/GDSL hydrolase family protein n=1 Tax=Rhodococcus sp. TaxID=1831 RepID=UPI003BB0C5D7
MLKSPTETPTESKLGTVAFWAFMLVAVIAVGAGLMVDQQRVTSATDALSEPSAPPGTVASAPVQLPQVYFVGDSFAVGSEDDGGQQWPDIIAERRQWVQNLLAKGGAGYVAQAREDGLDHAQRITESGLPDADLIVLSGGYNDSDATLGEFEEAVSATVDEVRRLAPTAPVVVLSAFYTEGDELPADFRRMNEVLKEQAQRIGAQYVDVSDLFLDRLDAVAEDGTHPTAEGQLLIAEAVLAQLGNLPDAR